MHVVNLGVQIFHLFIDILLDPTKLTPVDIVADRSCLDLIENVRLRTCVVYKVICNTHDHTDLTTLFLYKVFDLWPKLQCNDWQWIHWGVGFPKASNQRFQAVNTFLVFNVHHDY
jgi:hypothetical protein